MKMYLLFVSISINRETSVQRNLDHLVLLLSMYLKAQVLKRFAKGSENKF